MHSFHQFAQAANTMRVYYLLQIVVGILAALSLYAGNNQSSVNDDSQTAQKKFDFILSTATSPYMYTAPYVDTYIPHHVDNYVSSHPFSPMYYNGWQSHVYQNPSKEVLDGRIIEGWSIVMLDRGLNQKAAHPFQYYKYSLIGLTMDCFYEDIKYVPPGVLPVEVIDLDYFHRYPDIMLSGGLPIFDSSGQVCSIY